MNRIDRLLLKAKAAAASGVELTAAIIERSGDSWTAQAHLTDGTGNHAPSIKRATWATLERAVEHVRTMALEYPNSRDVPVIVDDLG